VADTTEYKVEALLRQGLSRKEIRRRLDASVEREKLNFYLKNLAYPADRARYQYLNLVLVLILGYVTIKKLFFALSFGTFSLTTLLALVVPAVNFYILREILRFRRLGYLFLFVLSSLSLLHAENRVFPEAVLVPVMVVLAGFLYFRLFPRNERAD